MNRLTPRELEIIGLASDGLSDKAIASALGIQVGTISTYWNRIRSKTKTSSRGAIIAKLVRNQMATESQGHPISFSDAGILLGLREKATRVEDILSLMPDPIMRTNLIHQIIYSNEAFRICFKTFDIAPPKPLPKATIFKRHLIDVIVAGAPKTSRLYFDTEGKRKVLEIRSVPEFDESRQVHSVLSLFRLKRPQP